MPPALGEGFAWIDSPAGTLLVADAFSDIPHGWTTRQLQLDGQPEHEQQGWGRVARAAGVEPSHLVRLRQVHGAAVFVAASPVAPQRPEADVAVTSDPALAVAVQVADCAPILLRTRDGRTVAAAHAGWRGTAANVSGVAVRSLVDDFGADVSTLSASIGPSIGPCCYEVGEELITAFADHGWTDGRRRKWFSRRDGRLFLDVWQANADQLRQAGIPSDQIHVSRLCTACHLDWFYSYRKEGKRAGRLAAFIKPRPHPA